MTTSATGGLPPSVDHRVDPVASAARSTPSTPIGADGAVGATAGDTVGGTARRRAAGAVDGDGAVGVTARRVRTRAERARPPTSRPRAAGPDPDPRASPRSSTAAAGPPRRSSASRSRHRDRVPRGARRGRRHRRARRPGRRRALPRADDAARPGHRPLRRDRRPGPRGHVDLPGRGLERRLRHLGARRGDQDRRPAIDVELMLEEGARVLEQAVGVRAAGTTRTPPVLRDAVGPARLGRPVRRPGSRRRPRPAVHAALARNPLRDLVTASPELPVARPARAGALQRLVRDVPALRGGPRRPAERALGLRHLRHARPSGCRRSPRWASTSSTCRRSTRSAGSTARAPTTP